VASAIAAPTAVIPTISKLELISWNASASLIFRVDESVLLSSPQLKETISRSAVATKA
jgi:hypothetical protein